MNVGNLVITEYGHLGELSAINGDTEAVVDVWDFGIENDTEYCDLRLCSLFEENKDEISKFNTIELKREKAVSVRVNSKSPRFPLIGGMMERLELSVKDVLENSNKIKYSHNPKEVDFNNPTLYFSISDIKKLIIENCNKRDEDYIELKFDWFIHEQGTNWTETSLDPIMVNGGLYASWYSLIKLFNVLKQSVKDLPIAKYIRESVDMQEYAINRTYFVKV